ncbi:MAG: hypothetical protein HY820_28770 [Acidobacteria bacterium]|nr:hypothetical protein [Acidobacteriota bacterium]
MKKTTKSITEGSSNVFADLGFANPEQEQLKAHLTLQIYRTIKQRGQTRRRPERSLASSSRTSPVSCADGPVIFGWPLDGVSDRAGTGY